MRPDGSGREQLTFDDRVNWFPHFTPDGKRFVYISYPPGTISHPADIDAELWMMPADGGEPKTVVRLFGGQGSMNCNSWAPRRASTAACVGDTGIEPVTSPV